MIPVGQKSGSLEKFAGLSMATPEVLKTWGVTRPYTLVRVEVNGGRGSPPTDRFVATKLEVLDGSDEFPIRVADVVAKLKIESQRILAEKEARAAIEATMLKAEKEAAKGEKPLGRRETGETTYATWEPRTQRLVVQFDVRITDGVLRVGRGTEVVDRRRSVTGDKPPHEGAGSVHGTVFGVETGVVFEVDKKGTEVSRRLLAARPIVEILPEPQYQRGVPLPTPPRR